jgi:S1-C subfamily serine protease
MIRRAHVVLTVFTLVGAGCLGAQRLDAQQGGQQVWSDHQRFATVSIGRVVDSQGHTVFAALCTGVIISPDTRTAYIVTAKHCFEEPANAHVTELRVRFAWEQRESQEADTGSTLPLVRADGKQTWTAANDGSDVAAISLDNLTGHFVRSPNGRIDAIGVQDFATDADAFDGASVFIYGYPGFIGNNLLTRAVTRGGIIAWTDPQGASTHRFLVDAAIFPGNSGGPVFKVPTGIAKGGAFAVGGTAALLGIVVATYQAPVDAAHAQVRVEGLGSLGVVEPVSEVQKLFVQMGATIATPTPAPAPSQVNSH